MKNRHTNWRKNDSNPSYIASSDSLPIIHPSRSHWTRAQMPQIYDVLYFESELRAHHISFKRSEITPEHLRATQNEINLALVFRIIKRGLNTVKHPLIVSSEHYILDGHNRWYAAKILRTPVHCIIVDRTITPLLHFALSVSTQRETISDTSRRTANV